MGAKTFSAGRVNATAGGHTANQRAGVSGLQHVVRDQGQGPSASYVSTHMMKATAGDQLEAAASARHGSRRVTRSQRPWRTTKGFARVEGPSSTFPLLCDVEALDTEPRAVVSIGAPPPEVVLVCACRCVAATAADADMARPRASVVVRSHCFASAVLGRPVVVVVVLALPPV